MMATFTNSMKSTASAMVPYITLFIFMFSVTLQYPIVRFMIADKGCTTYLPREVCTDLENNPEDNKKLQMFTESYISSLHSLGTITSVIVTVLLGSYSDKNGRKGALLVPCVGVAAYAIGMTIQGKLRFESAFFLYGSTLAMGLTGGMSAFITMMTCYVTDKTSAERRAIVLSSSVTAIGLGSLLGNFSAKLTASLVGTYHIYLVVLACQTISILLIITFLQEPEGTSNNLPTNVAEGRSGFIESIWQYFTAGPRIVLSAEDQEGGRRKHLVIMSVISMITIAFSTVDTRLLALHVQGKPFQWTTPVLNSFNSVKTFMTLVGTILVTRIYFRFTSSNNTRAELMLMLMAEGAGLFTVISLGITPFLLRFVPFLAVFSGPLLSARRAYLCNAVKSSETGSLLGFLNLLNTVAGPIGSTIVITIYSICKSFAPWIAFLLFAIVKIFTIWLLWLLARDVRSGGKKGL